MRVIQRGLLTTLFLTAIPLSVFSQSTSFATASAGNWTPIVAPDSIAAGFGSGLAASTTSTTMLPLSTTLGGATITITDSTGKKLPAQLFMVSPGQINYLIPAAAAIGLATVSVAANNSTFTGSVDISNVSPAIFTANNTGYGVPAAQVLSVGTDGKGTLSAPYQPGIFGFTTKPVDISSGSVYLVLYGTGLRRHSAIPVKASIGGISVPVAFAGPQGTLPGLDQVNLGPLPKSLSGKGSDVNLIVTVDGSPANITRVAIQ